MKPTRMPFRSNPLALLASALLLIAIVAAPVADAQAPSEIIGVTGGDESPSFSGGGYTWKAITSSLDSLTLTLEDGLSDVTITIDQLSCPALTIVVSGAVTGVVIDVRNLDTDTGDIYIDARGGTLTSCSIAMSSFTGDVVSYTFLSGVMEGTNITLEGLNADGVTPTSFSVVTLSGTEATLNSNIVMSYFNSEVTMVGTVDLDNAALNVPWVVSQGSRVAILNMNGPLALVASALELQTNSECVLRGGGADYMTIFSFVNVQSGSRLITEELVASLVSKHIEFTSCDAATAPCLVSLSHMALSVLEIAALEPRNLINTDGAMILVDGNTLVPTDESVPYLSFAEGVVGSGIISIINNDFPSISFIANPTSDNPKVFTGTVEAINNKANTMDFDYRRSGPPTRLLLIGNDGPINFKYGFTVQQLQAVAACNTKNGEATVFTYLLPGDTTTYTYPQLSCEPTRIVERCNQSFGLFAQPGHKRGDSVTALATGTVLSCLEASPDPVPLDFVFPEPTTTTTASPGGNKGNLGSIEDGGLTHEEKVATITAICVGVPVIAAVLIIGFLLFRYLRRRREDEVAEVPKDKDAGSKISAETYDSGGGLSVVKSMRDEPYPGYDLDGGDGTVMLGSQVAVSTVVVASME